MNSLNCIKNHYNNTAKIGVTSAYLCLIKTTYKEIVVTKDNIEPKVGNFQDLTGQRFGRLVTYKYAGIVRWNPSWFCHCDCGNTIIVRAYHVTSGNTSSCGCLRRERILMGVTKHGNNRRGYRAAEYGSWAGMISRCTQISGAAFKIYGGRGIKVCDRWLNSFENFLEDMGKRPSVNHSLDRIDSNGDYTPQNCRWATRKEQNRNTSRNRYITHNGETFTLGEWAERIGINYGTLYGRWKNGFPIEQILSKEKFKTGPIKK